MKKVATIAEFKEGGPIVVNQDGQEIAIFKAKDGKFYAVNNICPHQGAPLAEGCLEEYQVTCPWHAWGFDIRDGACDTVPQDRIASYPVQVQGEDILIEI